MAKLPLLIAEGRLPGRAGAVAADPGAAAQGARALGGLGDALERGGAQVAAIEKNARDTRDVISATADAAAELDAFRIELDKDADYTGRPEKFRQRAEQLKGRLTENMSGAAALDFEKSFERSYAVLAHSLRDKARKDEIEEHATKLDESNTKLLDVALRERDPRKKAMHLEQIAANIESAREANILSKPQADRIHKATLEKFERLQVSELRRTNPAAALRLLTAEEGKGGLKYMDPLARREMALAVQTEMQRRAALTSMVARATVAEAASLFEHGIRPENIEAARRAAAGNKDLTAKLETAEGNYHALAQFRTMDAGERRQAADAIAAKEAAEGLTAAQAALLAGYAKADAQIRTAFARDPMGAALAKNAPAAQALADAERAGDVTTFRATLDALAETQRREGVPAASVKLLPKQAEAALEATLAGPASQAQLDTIQMIQQRYGAEWAPRVFAQLDNGKLPGHVKVIAAFGPKAAGDPDTKRIIEAAKVPEADWAKVLPDDDLRKETRRQVGALGGEIRAAMARLPGGNQRYADFHRLTEDVAFSLLADKAAGNAADAAAQAWGIVHNRHFALAGSVAIPKVNGAPIADPAAISAYQDYVKATLDKYDIAPPPATAATRLLTPDQRREQYVRHLKTFGAWVTDRDDRGMILLDGFNVPVPLRAGGVVRADFEAPAKNEEFKTWWAPRRSGHPNTWRPPAAPAPAWMGGQ